MPVNEPIYRQTFNNNFNLHFHSPQSDICAKCDSLKLKILASQDNEQEKLQLTMPHELHLRKAETARNSLRHGTENPKKIQLIM